MDFTTQASVEMSAKQSVPFENFFQKWPRFNFLNVLNANFRSTFFIFIDVMVRSRQ